MSSENRRSHIIDAAIPLIHAHGAEVTTRQIADAAGIAEGTVFRAFGDKQELIDAVVASVIDPAPLVAELEGISPGATLTETVTVVVGLLRKRVEAVMRLLTALGPRDHARHRAHAGAKHPTPLGEATAPLARLLAAHSDELRVAPDVAVEYLRILVVGTSMRHMDSGREIAVEELVDFILRGLSQKGD